MASSDSLDTNIILRLILSDNLDQREKAYKLISKGQHHIFDAAITEVVYVLASCYNYNHITIAQKLNCFFEQFCENIDYNKTITKMILPFWAEHPSLSFVDCYLAFISGLSNSKTLITFDKKLASQHPNAKLVI